MGTLSLKPIPDLDSCVVDFLRNVSLQGLLVILVHKSGDLLEAELYVVLHKLNDCGFHLRH